MSVQGVDPDGTPHNHDTIARSRCRARAFVRAFLRRLRRGH